MDAKEIRRTTRFTHYAIASARLAWEDAEVPEVPSERVGVLFATGIGGIEWLLNQHLTLLEKGPGRVSPFMVPALMGERRRRSHRDDLRIHRAQLLHGLGVRVRSARGR